eukprot:416132-Prorocentrum_minimum.AAC.4
MSHLGLGVYKVGLSGGGAHLGVVRGEAGGGEERVGLLHCAFHALPPGFCFLGGGHAADLLAAEGQPSQLERDRPLLVVVAALLAGGGCRGGRPASGVLPLCLFVPRLLDAAMLLFATLLLERLAPVKRLAPVERLVRLGQLLGVEVGGDAFHGGALFLLRAEEGEVVHVK